MTPENFFDRYEQALASKQWSAVDPLIHPDACVTFSTGTVHKGQAAVRSAFEANFQAIQDDCYRMSNIHWVHRGNDVAVCLFDFAWSGRIDGQEASGAGRGTAVLIREGNDWQLLTEHLGSAP